MRLKAFLIIIIVLNIFLFLPFQSQGAFLDVTINEIAWMGTSVSANDEWIELKNNTSNVINLEGWVLKSADGTPEIKLTGNIVANGFFLLERTDDNTIPEITADLIYKGAMGNNGENLEFYDNFGNLVDEVNCSSGWLAGDNTTKQTMERTPTGWQTSENPGGTPKTTNSIKQIADNEIKNQIAEIDTLPNEAKKTEEKTVVINYPAGIIFNEILPSPEGADETEEWIELQNQNDFEVDISGWKIRDTEGVITTFILSEGTKISGKGFLVLKRPETKITLNNDGDKLELLKPDGTIADSVIFEKSLLGQSYNKIGNSWEWSKNLTPGTPNILSSPTNILKNNPEQNNPQLDKEQASIAGSLPGFDKKDGGNNRLNIFLIASAIAISLSIIILFLKKTISKNIQN